ncbi:MAG: HAD-IA family hydrolase [Anaerolineae bacterium]|nr:HAD-IA family hydrolase [Anaerolineae bacterium]
MKTQIDTVIFDFDGVLVNTGPDIASAANYILQLYHLEELPQDTIVSYIGGGAEVLLRRCLKDRADELISQALPEFNQRYNEYCCVQSHLYPDVKLVLDQLKTTGKRLAIATQKKEATTHVMIDRLGIGTYFDCIVGPDSVTHRKPHPESVLRILDSTNTRAERAVVVGDMPTDIQAGKAGGTYTCGVFYGYGAGEDILASAPDLTITRLSQLLDWME